MPKSSKEWMRRHVTDAYVKKAKTQGYRSRAAFKLLEIDAREKLLRKGAVVVDLGAAPGGWSQVAVEKTRPGGTVIAVDLLPIEPIAGVTVLRGDFRQATLVASLNGAKVDVVLSDLSPNLSGVASTDQARWLELAMDALEFCRVSLKPGGAFLIKAFQGEAFESLHDVLKAHFARVSVTKPPASRGESRETYLVCRSR